MPKGIHAPKHIRSATPQDRSIIEDHKSALTLHEISAKYGLSVSAVHQVLKRYNIPGRRRGRRRIPVAASILAIAQSGSVEKARKAGHRINYNIARAITRLEFNVNRHGLHVAGLSPAQFETYANAIDRDELTHIEAMMIATDDPFYGDDELEAQFAEEPKAPRLVRGSNGYILRTKELEEYIWDRYCDELPNAQIARKLGTRSTWVAGVIAQMKNARE